MIHNLIKLNTHEDKQSYQEKFPLLKEKLESNDKFLDYTWYAYCSSLCVISFPTENSARVEFIQSEFPGHGDGTLLIALITKELLDKKLKYFTVSKDIPESTYTFFTGMGYHFNKDELTLKLNK